MEYPCTDSGAEYLRRNVNILNVNKNSRSYFVPIESFFVVVESMDFSQELIRQFRTRYVDLRNQVHSALIEEFLCKLKMAVVIPRLALLTSIHLGEACTAQFFKISYREHLCVKYSAPVRHVCGMSYNQSRNKCTRE